MGIDHDTIGSIQDLIYLMKRVQSFVLCCNAMKKTCDGLFEARIGIRKSTAQCCYSCRKKNARFKNAQRGKRKRKMDKNNKANRKIKNYREKCHRLQENVNLVFNPEVLNHHAKFL